MLAVGLQQVCQRHRAAAREDVVHRQKRNARQFRVDGAYRGHDVVVPAQFFHAGQHSIAVQQAHIHNFDVAALHHGGFQEALYAAGVTLAGDADRQDRRRFTGTLLQVGESGVQTTDFQRIR